MTSIANTNKYRHKTRTLQQRFDKEGDLLQPSNNHFQVARGCKLVDGRLARQANRGKKTV